jgi:hypothetical protein
MHPDLERERFIDHIQKLQQELERLRMDPGRREMKQIDRIKERMERLTADNAVLRSRLAGRTAVLAGAQPVRVASGDGCRQPNTGLGSLSYAEVVRLHVDQLDSAGIAAAAGVHHSSLSRWRKVNQYVQVWTKRVACGSTSLRFELPAQDPGQGNLVGADGRDQAQTDPIVPVRQGGP